MKLFNTFRPVGLLGCVGAVVVGLVLPNVTLADGKGASKLMKVNTVSSASPTQPLASASSIGCSLCKDTFVKMPDPSAKGMRLAVLKNTPVHACPACATTITTVGSGKAKVDRFDHTCGNNAGSKASCCAAAR